MLRAANSGSEMRFCSTIPLVGTILTDKRATDLMGELLNV